MTAALAAAAVVAGCTAIPSRTPTLVNLTPGATPVGSDLTRVPERLRAGLAGGKVVAFEQDGRLVVLARHSGDGLNLGGTFDARFEPATGLAEFSDAWVATLKVENLDRAIIDLRVLSGPRSVGYAQFRGRDVRALPNDAEPLRAGSIERFVMPAAALGAAREVSAYVPRAAPRRVLVVFDRSFGGEFLFRQIDLLVAKGEIAPLVVVAPAHAPATFKDGRDLRVREFVSGFDGDARGRFDRFVAEELLPEVRTRFAVSTEPSDVAFVGSSASSAWVLESAARPQPLARTWGAFSVPPPFSERATPGPTAGSLVMGGGTFEPDYMASSLNVCVRVRLAGGDCRFFAVDGGHAQGTWDELIIQLLLDWK